ncbi:MAG TPA: polysaccharide deacetylase family protein [Pseudonocardiaceae bacterium]|nr:polysaccharide deacetylase family protein [Pseudonocardiaceae bacterium]
MSCPAHHHDRRTFIGLLGVGLAATIAGCSTSAPAAPPALPANLGPAPAPSPLPPQPLPPIPPPHPGTSTTISRGVPGTRNICLTVDDGFCVDCVAGYVNFAQRTGIHLTFSPNGTYAHCWAPHADVIRPLLERRQVQIINHTFSHKDLSRMTDQQVKAELERNEEWVNTTFGITTRPYYRPPYGFHNKHVDGLAANLGYTKTTMWDGSYSDSEAITPAFLVSQAQKYLQPGVIMLGHANHPTVLGLFDQILTLIKQRNLTPVTMDEMFGTSRATG